MVEKRPFDVDIRVGTVTRAEAFPETDKSGMCKVWIDLGDREVQSCAQLLHHHDPADIEGRQVLAATNLGTVTIAGFESEVLTLGVPGGDGYPVLVTPEAEVPDGGELY
ncbi:MAG: tRNA-binding protein [Candidatus Nanohaloarchaea archaeon]|nr:tRNA-binding protein [Candidatus Nanohaloarchaea archaeon]